MKINGNEHSYKRNRSDDLKNFCSLWMDYDSYFPTVQVLLFLREDQLFWRLDNYSTKCDYCNTDGNLFLRNVDCDVTFKDVSRKFVKVSAKPSRLVSNTQIHNALRNVFNRRCYVCHKSSKSKEFVEEFRNPKAI